MSSEYLISLFINAQPSPNQPQRPISIPPRNPIRFQTIISLPLLKRRFRTAAIFLTDTRHLVSKNVREIPLGYITIDIN